MAQTGYTPIQIYYSTTASAAPTAGNLANGELAININDGKLYYKDSGGVVQVLATKGAGTIGGSNTQVQYNSSGSLAGSANLTFDGTTLTANALTVSNNATLSAGTANGVAYLNGSKVVTTGSALTFDGTTFQYTGASNFATSTGSVGIGTSSPATKLDTAGTMRSTGNTTPSSGAGLELLYDSGNTRGIVQVYDRSGSAYRQLALDGSSILMRIAGTTQATLDASGNLGLGVTPSAWGASVFSGVFEGKQGAFWAPYVGGPDLYTGVNAYYDTGWKYKVSSNAATYYRQTAGQHQWATAPSGTAGNAITFTQAMTLDANGLLGINTTSPGGYLDIQGTQTYSLLMTRFGAAANTGLRRATGTQASPTIIANGDVIHNISFQGYDGAGGYQNAARVWAVIDGSTISATSMPGALLFGTTASGSATITERLRIANNGAWGLAGANYGTAGQVLTSNGSGSAPTWQNGGAGSSQWTTSGSDIYYNTGIVAVGASSGLTGYGQIYVKTGSSGVNFAGVGIRGETTYGIAGVRFYDSSTGALSGSVQTRDNYLNLIAPTTNGLGTSGDGGIDFRCVYSGSYVTRAILTPSGCLGLASSTPTTYAQRLYINTPGYSGNGSGVSGSSLHQVFIDNLGTDNSGSVNPVGIRFSGGGGGVPRGQIFQVATNANSTGQNGQFFVATTGNSPQGSGVGMPTAGVYRGNSLDTSNGYAPTTWGSPAVGNGGMTSFGVYDNQTSDYDGTFKVGVQVQLAGSYGGASYGNWGGYCFVAKIATNFGASSSGTNIGFFADITNAGSGNNWGVYINNGNAAKPGGGSWTATSDSRVKTVLGQYTRGLADVLKLNVVDYEYNGKGGHAVDGKRLTGVVAQELQDVFPEMVSKRLGKLEETDTQDTEILMVDNSALVYALVNAVKELKAEIEALKAAK